LRCDARLTLETCASFCILVEQHSTGVPVIIPSRAKRIFHTFWEALIIASLSRQPEIYNEVAKTAFVKRFGRLQKTSSHWMSGAQPKGALVNPPPPNAALKPLCFFPSGALKNRLI
jgi:hypothetical protein